MAKGSGGGGRSGRGGGGMSSSRAAQVKADYARYDTAFRDAKKRKDFKLASSYKAKRDALSGALEQAIKVR